MPPRVAGAVAYWEDEKQESIDAYGSYKTNYNILQYNVVGLGGYQ